MQPLLHNSTPVAVDHIAAHHANEMLGVYVHAMLSDHPLPPDMLSLPVCSDQTAIPGVRSRIANYTALIAGRGTLRCLADPQMQSRYHLHYVHAPAEDRGAGLNELWIGDNAFNKHAVVIDGHDNRTPGLNFARIGSLASRRAIAAAHILGHDKFVVCDDSFTDTVNTAVIVDDYVENTTESHIAAAEARYDGLVRLADMSAEELDEHYRTHIDALGFYRVIEIPTLDEQGNYSKHLEELESIQVERAFTPLSLTRALRKHLGIGENEAVLSQTWGHDGMSRKVDEHGRKLFFGGVFCPIDPLEPDGGQNTVWVRQRRVSKERWKRETD